MVDPQDLQRKTSEIERQRQERIRAQAAADAQARAAAAQASTTDASVLLKPVFDVQAVQRAIRQPSAENIAGAALEFLGLLPMGRVAKGATTVRKLYHVTDPAAAAAIRATGLRKGSFLTTSVDIAKGRVADKKMPAEVLEFLVPENLLRPSKARPDVFQVIEDIPAQVADSGSRIARALRNLFK